MTSVLVTGATGATGSRLVRLLRAQAVTVRALVRDPARAEGIVGDGVQLALGDFADRASLRAAVEGVDSIYLACGNVPEQVEYESAVIDEAERSGVRRIVKLSARGAAVGAPVAYWHWHGLIEQHLAAADVKAVVLRPGFAMTNLLAAAEHVRSQAMLFTPAADARIAMIDPIDVAAVAAAALTTDGHDGNTYVLTGPRAITYQQVADDIAAVAGRPVGFVDLPPEAAGPALVQAGLPAFVADQIVAVFDALRSGAQATTTDTVTAITGRAPRSFADFACDHAAAFRAESSLSRTG